MAIWICKLSIIAGKLLGKKGSSAPGGLALRVCPQILKRLSAQVKYKTIAVCGTNGKTTTNNLIYAILRAKGFRVVCNAVGANMLSGAVTAYVSECGIFGKLNADYACIEMDEAYAVKIFDHIKPDYMIITNFFRDQLDRYGEVETAAALLKQAIENTPPETTLILNADDPLCAALGDVGRKSEFFGICENADTPLNETKDGQFCAFCRGELRYNYRHYSQLGDYYCENCGFSRPAPDFLASDIKLSGVTEFTVSQGGKTRQFRVNYRGFYNIYNILAAFSAVSLLGTETENISDILSSHKPQIGRMEEFNIDGVSVILNLSKNPAGFNQAISAMLNDPRRKDVVIIIHDNPSDGTDISWLWDVDFEQMNSENFSRVTACGIRAEDVALRLKYAEIPNADCEKNIKSALGNALKNRSETLYILANYTPLFETQNILKELGGER